MKVLLHMLVDVPGAQSFSAAARAASKFARGTAKVRVDAASIEEAKVVSPALIKEIQDVIENETGITIRDDQAKRIASTLHFGTEMDEIHFYEIYPEDEI